MQVALIGLWVVIAFLIVVDNYNTERGF